MGKLRWVLAGVAGLGLFSAGYLVGRQNVGESTGGSESSTRTAHRPNRQDPPEFLPGRTRAKPALQPTDGAPPSYRKIVEMVSKGELRIDGVQIDYDFLPGYKVGEFFGLSDEQLAEMKRLGLKRLREKQNREQSLAKIHGVSESGMVFDLPADLEFATAQRDLFVDDLGQAFGADVAAMLQPSINGAYNDCDAPRHVRYSLTRREDLAAGMYDCETRINLNEDGSYVIDEQGLPHLNCASSSGTLNLNDTKPEAFRPRYHYLWEREMGRR